MEDPQGHPQTSRALALSVRQPYAELIISGRKDRENRSVRTRVRGRVYIYASKKLAGTSQEARDTPTDAELPRGKIVGTVEITSCIAVENGYAWLLQNPERITPPLQPRRRAQPVWFYPF